MSRRDKTGGHDPEDRPTHLDTQRDDVDSTLPVDGDTVGMDPTHHEALEAFPETTVGGADDGEPSSTAPGVGTGASAGDIEATLAPDTSAPVVPTSAPATRGATQAPAAESTLAKAMGEGELFAQRFELEELLGEGGMGRVFLARDRYVDGRQVALKVLHPDYSRNEVFRGLFFREIKTAQGFVNEYVNQVRDTGQTEDGTLFLTMDYVAGEDLDRLLARETQLNVRHALDITLQVLKGLKSGHDHGFIHRDIKPSNLMLAGRITKVSDNPFGVGVRLLDFGIAGLAADMKEGELVGTPTYMSPEQVQKKRLDARSDLFAVGVVLYEMISGTRPFQGKTIAQITSSILEKDVRPMIRDISDLSKPLQELLSKALEKDRDRRFQSADEFIKAIESSAAYRLPRLMPAWAGAALVLLTIGGIASGYMLWGKMQEVARVRDTNAQLRQDLGEQRGDELSATDRAILKAQSSLAESQLAGENTQEKLEQARIQVQTLTAEIGDLEIKIGAERDQTAQAVVERNEFRDTVTRTEAEALQERQAHEAERTRLLGELAAYRDKEVSESPESRIATTFDIKLLPFWKDRKGAQAREALTNLSASAFVGSIAGETLLSGITDLAEQLEIYTINSGASAAQRLNRTRAIAALEIILNRFGDLDALELQADWLLFGEEREEGQPNRRFELIKDLVEGQNGLRREAEEAIESEDVLRTVRLAQVTSGDALQGPRAVLAYNSLFDDEATVTVELERFTAALQQRLVTGDDLDYDALSKLDAVDDWAELLDGNSRLGSQQARRTARLFRYAKSWISDPKFLGSENGAQLFDPAVLEDANAPLDWTTALSLGYQLLQPESSYPAPAVGNLVYRVRDDRGIVTWLSCNPGESSLGTTQSTWSVECERRRGVEGRDKDKAPGLNYSRTNKIFLRGSTRVLKLNTVPLPEVVRYELTANPEPPGLAVRASERADFLAQIDGASILCLYQKDDRGVERWFSPRYGLICEKYQNDGKTSLVLELVYGSYAR